MPWQQVKGFLGRRLSRTEYLGLHLTIGLTLTLLLTLVYVGVVRAVFAHETLDFLDHLLGSELAEHRNSSTYLRGLMLAITWLGAFEFMLVFVPVVGWLLWRHKRGLALVWFFAALGGALINQTLKFAHDRDRPEFKSSLVHEHNKSFPSGHSTGSMCSLGMLAYFLWLRWHDWPRRIAATTAIVVLIGAIGFSRVYLGAHFITDVLAGYCIGGAWLTICISTYESVRRRHLSLAAPPPAPAR